MLLSVDVSDDCSTPFFNRRQHGCICPRHTSLSLLLSESPAAAAEFLCFYALAECVRESKACARILLLGKRPKIFFPSRDFISQSKKNLSIFHLCLRLFSQVHANYQRENIRFLLLLFPLSVSSNRVCFPFSFLWVGGNKCCMHPYSSDLAASSPSLFKMPRRDLSPYFTFFSFPRADGDISLPPFRCPLMSRGGKTQKDFPPCPFQLSTKRDRPGRQKSVGCFSNPKALFYFTSTNSLLWVVRIIIGARVGVCQAGC